MPTKHPMELNRLKTLYLLDMIAADQPKSQRDFSNVLNISLGLVNAFIKRLVKKGYCKVRSLPRNRIKYILTPAGAMEKTRLTYEYISISYQYFKQARTRLQDFYAELEVEGTRRVVFYGAGELAEVAFLSMKGTKIQLIDVVDPTREGESFAQFVVKGAPQFDHLSFDIVLITTADDHEIAAQEIEAAGVPAERIRFFN